MSMIWENGYLSSVRGSAAMDVARTAIRKGLRHVTVYSITEITGGIPKTKVEYAKLGGSRVRISADGH